MQHISIEKPSSLQGGFFIAPQTAPNNLVYTMFMHIKKLPASHQLTGSYISYIVLEAGLEPAQPQWPRDFKSLVSTDSTIRASINRKGNKWSGKRDSNSRPQPWQGCALPTELFPQVVFEERVQR